MIFVRTKTEREFIRKSFQDKDLFDALYYPIVDMCDEGENEGKNVWSLGFSECLIEQETNLPSSHRVAWEAKCLSEFKKKLLDFSETLSFEEYINIFFGGDEVGTKFIPDIIDTMKQKLSSIEFEKIHLCSTHEDVAEMEIIENFYTDILENNIPKNIKKRIVGNHPEYGYFFNIYEEMYELVLGIVTSQIKLQKFLFDRNILKLIKPYV
jgi:hypothetical protein